MFVSMNCILYFSAIYFSYFLVVYMIFIGYTLYAIFLHFLSVYNFLDKVEDPVLIHVLLLSIVKTRWDEAPLSLWLRWG